MTELARLKFEILKYAISKDMHIDVLSEKLNELTNVENVSVSYSLKDMEQIFFAGYFHPSIENSESEKSLDSAFKKVIDRHNSNSR